MSKRILLLVKVALFLTMLIALSVCSVACDKPSQSPEPPTKVAISFVKEGNVEIEMYKSKIIQITNENPINMITWSAEDSSVVKLESEIFADKLSAKITGLKVGTTKIVVSDGTDSISTTVNVIQPKYPPTINVKDKIVAFTGETYDLLPTFTYDNAVLEDITFEYVSSDESILQTNADGKITPISFGNAVVTVKANFMGDEIVKNVSVTVIEKPVSVTNKIGYFDSAYGAYQLTSESAQLSFSESVAYGDESGSLEILVTQNDGVFKGAFASLIQKNISNTAYVLFRVYNPNDVAIVVEFDEDIGATVCNSNQWTTVICKTADIQKAEGLNNQTADIAGLTLMAYAQDGSASLKEKKLYVSSMTAEEKEEGKIGYFDTIYGVTQITSPTDADANQVVDIEYSTEVKYGDEKGSTKITWNVAPPAGESAYLVDLIQKDVSNYDYLIFRIYNPSDSDIIFKFQPWIGWARCTTNSWSDVKVTSEEIATVKNLTDITGLVFLFEGGADLIGKSVYLSAMTAGIEEIVDGGEGEEGGELEELEGVKIIGFDKSAVSDSADMYCPNASKSYSTEVKYGNEVGSTKLVQGAGGSNILFESWFTSADLSVYDYIVFRVYNANDYAIKFELDWLPLVTCAVGVWTDVKINVSDLPVNYQTNLNGIQFKAMDDATNQAREGLTIYLSAMYGVKEEGTKVINFDGSAVSDSGDMYCPNASKSYSTEVKYGNESGSTKLVQGAGGSNILFESWFTSADVSVYDYVIFRVYNANDYAIKFELDWLPVVTCAVGEWTEVKINVSDLPVNYQTNLNGIQFKAMDDATNQAREGLTVYLSAMYGCSNSTN